MSGPSEDDFIGKVVLGRYRIVRSLAKGGMGVIYLARQEGADGFARPVVIKQILSQFVNDESVIQMFKREARIMSNMRHPGVVAVLDFGHEDDSYLMVLEYIHGFHAGRWRRYVQSKGANFSAEFAVHIVICVLDALHYAHNLIGADGKPLRIIHRDVSPSNVLIDVEGHVKLADFGIARAESDKTEYKTGEATVKGKLPYLAPELFRGVEPGPESDLYAAAMVLHEMILGRNIFRTDDPTTTVGMVLQHVPDRLDELRDDISPELADVVAKGLEKKREDRYRTAAEFAQALRGVRSLTADDAAAQLAAACQVDFRDPEMTALLGGDDLATLERAWRDFKAPEPIRALIPSEPAPTLAQQLAEEISGDQPLEPRDFGGPAPLPKIQTNPRASATPVRAHTPAKGNMPGGAPAAQRVARATPARGMPALNAQPQRPSVATPARGMTVPDAGGARSSGSLTSATPTTRPVSPLPAARQPPASPTTERKRPNMLVGIGVLFMGVGAIAAAGVFLLNSTDETGDHQRTPPLFVIEDASVTLPDASTTLEQAPPPPLCAYAVSSPEDLRVLNSRIPVINACGATYARQIAQANEIIVRVEVENGLPHQLGICPAGLFGEHGDLAFGECVINAVRGLRLRRGSYALTFRFPLGQ